MSVNKVIMDLDLSSVPVTFWRPDCVDILKDKDAIFRFNRYWRILAGKAIAKFLLCKKINVEPFNPNDIDTMWRIHDIYMEELKELLHEKDDDEIERWYKSRHVEDNNLLKLKRDIAWAMLTNCRFCERLCGVNRIEGKLGFCQLNSNARIASVFIHVGEEPELVPSFTIFFSRCNFKCVYCQNWDISQRTTGMTIPPIELAITIEKRWNSNEIRNVNWVGGDPGPNIHYIFDVLLHTNASVPQIWNSNFYQSVEALKLLDGVIDLWLPDFKYGNNECAMRLSKAPRYFDVISRNFTFVNKNGDEILIRHLVLPNHLDCCTIPILKWIKNNMDLAKVRVNIMAQYRPEYKAHDYKEISRRITHEEYSRAINTARELGIPLTM